MVNILPRFTTTDYVYSKLPDFHNFWSALKSSEEAKGTSPETDIVKWTFKDGTVQEVKQEEHSVCFQNLWSLNEGYSSLKRDIPLN